ECASHLAGVIAALAPIDGSVALPRTRPGERAGRRWRTRRPPAKTQPRPAAIHRAAAAEKISPRVTLPEGTLHLRSLEQYTKRHAPRARSKCRQAPPRRIEYLARLASVPASHSSRQ